MDLHIWVCEVYYTNISQTKWFVWSSRRIINNGVTKVKLGLREQKSLESVATHNIDDNEQVYQELSQRIYNVTDALKSKYTKRAYGYAFSQFLRDGAKTQDSPGILRS